MSNIGAEIEESLAREKSSKPLKINEKLILIF